MNPSLREQLKKWNQLHQESTPKKKKDQKKTTSSQTSKREKSESLSESDIKSLMGINHRGLRRGKGGAWR